METLTDLLIITYLYTMVYSVMIHDILYNELVVIGDSSHVTGSAFSYIMGREYIIYGFIEEEPQQITKSLM